MRLFGRGDRPQTMEWGSSFAEAAAPTRTRRRSGFGSDAYDARVTGDPQNRPIGSRRKAAGASAGTTGCSGGTGASLR